eukprot:15461285-Alexandrium_andersonii.AAC.1
MPHRSRRDSSRCQPSPLGSKSACGPAGLRWARFPRLAMWAQQAKCLVDQGCRTDVGGQLGPLASV